MSIDNRNRLSVSSSLNELFRHRVWDAKVPINIKVAEDDLRLLRGSSTLNLPNIRSRPFFVLAPRTSYLPLLLPQLQRHYDDVFTAASSLLEACAPWLEFAERPLSWHYPIGHLFDECNLWHSSTLPWTLTLHFTKYPKDQLIPMNENHIEEGGGAIGSHFYSTLKQAEYLKHGSSKGVMNLSKVEQTQLWDGLWTHSFDKFWNVYSKIMGNEDSIAAWKNFPMRLYRRDAESLRQITQGPIGFQKHWTLRDIASQLSIDDQTRLVCHGIVIPHDSSLSWLAMYFTYPDGFLHFIVT